MVEINEQLYNFYIQWQSHGKVVKGWAQILYNQFIVVLADEEATGVSGCSTDSMVRIIQSFERQYQIVLFDRMTITFLINNKVQPLPYHQIKYALEQGFIETDSLVFNNTIATKLQLINEWLVPLDKSWIWNKLV